MDPNLVDVRHAARIDQRDQACNACGAVGEACCTTAQARRQMNDTYEHLTRRQSETIGMLTRELGEARQVIGDLRRTQAAAS